MIKSISTGIPLIVTDSIVPGGMSDNIFMVKGELRDKENYLFARSKGKFVAIDRENFSPDLEESKKEIFSLIDELPTLWF